MTETTEFMKELGITDALFHKWQQEDEDVPEPAPCLTRQDGKILAQRKSLKDIQAVDSPQLLREEVLA